jgi:Pectate lyase superfamily protein
MKTYFYNVRDFGALGDGITDDLSAFQRTLQAMKAVPPLLDASGGAVMLVPEGNYFLSKTLVLSHQVEILGITGRNGQEALGYSFTVDPTGRVTHLIGLPGGMSRLLFPAGITGILVALGGPAKGGLNAGTVDHASGTIIRNIAIQSADRSTYIPSAPEEYGHGISVKAVVIVDNCYVYNFAGNGLHFVSPSAPPPTPNGTAFYDIKHRELGDLYLDNKREESGEIIQYNANTIDSQISNTFCSGNLLNGVYIIGSNSGNMLFQSVHSFLNGRYGFFDSERSTGNTYMNCYSDSNIKGDYFHLSSILLKEINADTSEVTYTIAGKAGSGSLYLNCYQESASSTVYAPATIIEGQLSLDGYNDNPVDVEFQVNYKAITGLDLPNTHFTALARPSVIRQSGSGTFASTEIPFGVRVFGGNHNNVNTVKTISVDLGGSLPAVALSLFHDATSQSTLVLPQQLYADPSNWWTISNGTSLPPLRLSTRDSKWGNSSSIKADDNNLWLQKGYFLGDLRQDPPTKYSHRPNFIGYGWNKPTDAIAPMLGGWQQGDMVWNHNPSPASADINLTYAGWMCVAASEDGVASQWAGIGKLEVLP